MLGVTELNQVLDWLDKQILADKNKELKISDDFVLCNIELCHTKEIQITNVRKIAELFDFPIYTKPFKIKDENCEYISEVWFEYKGYKFFNLERQ